MGEIKDYWEITYINKLTGTRESYMRIAFPTWQSARDELDRILKDAKKWKKKSFNVTEMIKHKIRIPSSMCGSHWKIKKIKLKIR